MELGLRDSPRRKNRKNKFRATPDAFPEDGPIGIEDAYSELTHHAFSVWIRLMVASADELKIGRAKLSKLLKYSEGRSNAVLLELKRKGYITWITSPGMPSECVILRRAKIRARTHFVRISRFFAESQDEDDCIFYSHSDDAKVENGENRISYAHIGMPKNPHYPVPKNWALIFLPTSAYILTHKRLYSYPHRTVFFTHITNKPQKLLDVSCGKLGIIRAAFRSDQKPVRKRKFVDENGYTFSSQKSKSDLIKESYRDKIREKILIEKQRRKDVCSVAKRSYIRDSATKTKIDFASLDQRGDPALSFDPDSRLRKGMLEILSKSTRDKSRKKLLSKIGSEFGRIYTRYRRQAEQSLGIPLSPFAYQIPEKEKRYAELAGMWCVVKGVTPRDLLEYWHKNIKTFADKSMVIPPLVLLQSPGMVDQVACSSIGGKEESEEKTPKKETKTHSKPRNSFSSVGVLDRRFRRRLEKAGFDTSDYSDRYLVTIQQMAEGISKGQDIFVPLKIRKMVEWMSKNLYA